MSSHKISSHLISLVDIILVAIQYPISLANIYIINISNSPFGFALDKSSAEREREIEKKEERGYEFQVLCQTLAENDFNENKTQAGSNQILNLVS